MSNPFESPSPVPNSGPPNPRPVVTEGDATGGVIPYKNPHALLAYYGGILTILCCVTPVPLGIAPLVLGVIGLRKRARNPIIKGSVHAWIGIVLGGLSALASVAMAIILVISFVTGRINKH